MAQSSKAASSQSRKNQAKGTPKANSKANPKKANRNPTGSRQSGSGDSTRWTFFSNHAHVLICLYQDSKMVLRDIANRVGITERAVQRIIQDLEDAGHVQRERVGRRNHYHVMHNKHLRHPIEAHCTVDMLFEVILENT